MVRFTEKAIEGNVDIALMHVVYDVAEEAWFDGEWATARLAELGHDVEESFVQHWLEERAEYGYLARDLGKFKAI